MNLFEMFSPYWFAVTLAAIAVSAAVVLLVVIWRSGMVMTHMSSDEQCFNEVFAVMSAERKQLLIEYTARKYGCNRRAAMRHAVDDHL